MSSTTGIGSKTVMSATFISLSSLTLSAAYPAQIDADNEYHKSPYANISGYEEGASSISTGLYFQNRLNEQSRIADVILRSPENRKTKIYVYKTKMTEDKKKPSSLGDGYLVSEV